MTNKTRSKEINDTILQATQSLLSTLSTSYGPKGLDKMIEINNETIITNDGATILKYFNTHPIHKILSSVSKTQDINTGDGTTSVVLLISSLLNILIPLKDTIHPSILYQSLEIAKNISIEYIDKVKVKIEETDYINVALTTLNSKIASKSLPMATIAIQALKHIRMDDIKIIKKVGGDIDDIKMYKSILLPINFSISHLPLFTNNNINDIINDNEYMSNNVSNKIRLAKILVIQFCLSPPKPYLDSKIEIKEYQQLEQFVIQEKEYIKNLVKKIKNTGCDILIIQKSLLKESCSEMAHYFLKKYKINVIDGVDRSEITYICNKLNIKPISDIDLLDTSMFNNAPINIDNDNIFKVRKVDEYLEIMDYGCSIIITGCDDLVVDEAERSFHDCLCVIKSLIEEPYIVPGGCAIETGIGNELSLYSNINSIIINEISKGFISMGHYLAENAGLYSIDVVNTLRKNISINKNYGISIINGVISDMVNDEKVVQPAAVSKSMVLLAFETVQMLIKIDDILPSRE